MEREALKQEKTAKWLYLKDKKNKAKCSNCGLIHDTEYGINYCPHCGAKMESEEQEPKTGHWSHDGSQWKNRWICSKCGTSCLMNRQGCPNCGSRMESEV